MPRSPARACSSALLHVKYFVKTARGLSDAFCRVMRDFLLRGAGQGSGASPPVWLPTVARTLTALTALAPLAASFADPRGDAREARSADSFVGDASSGCNWGLGTGH